MCGLFTPLINRPTLSRVGLPRTHLGDPCEGGVWHWPDSPHTWAAIDWFCGRRLRFPAWTSAVTVAFTH